MYLGDTMNKEQIKTILKEIGLVNTDTVLIHSGLRKIGNIEGGAITLIEALIEYLSDGLLIFPTHSWDIMTEDNQVFDTKATPSCVGALTNVARLYKGFLRSMHPTHSVCAYGKKALEYVSLDDTSTTPVSPNGCFGVLKNLNAKILFLGAPLSKNTFIHSIEEEFNVDDRFTSHIYHFISKNESRVIDYFMPKHYSTKSAHISEHYEKLHDVLKSNNALIDFKFGNAESYLLDAKKTHEVVANLLKKNINIFDDFTPITVN